MILRNVLAVAIGRVLDLPLDLSWNASGGGAPAWTPTDLFANGEQGAWYDPSDFSTMFQDSAGTIPVTAAGQSVGRILDKSGNGNHASQATAAARPVLSARKNLVTGSEDFSNAAWTKSNVTVTPGQAANATGSMTLCKVEATTTAGAIVRQICTSAGGSNGNTLRVLARKGSGPNDCHTFGLYNITTATLLSLFTINYDTGAVDHSFGSGATAISLGGGLWEIKQTLVAGISGNDTLQVYAGFTGNAEAAGEFAYIGEYQLERGPSATTYQRVNTATDYDTVGFPHYLKFDGVDDFLSTGSIDFTGTDKMTVVAGVTKLSDAADGTILNIGDPIVFHDGSFRIEAPGSSTVTKYQFASRGTATSAPFTVSASYNAPHTGVVAAIAAIGSDTAQLRINGALVNSQAADQGTGNYGNYSLYIGHRGSIYAAFNGHIYQLVVRGALTADLEPIESFTADKTGVVL